MLLDTCIVIDLLRGRDAAADFVGGLAGAPAVSAITATEIIAGCRNAKERRQIDQLFSQYTVLDVDLEIASLAGEFVRQYGPGHATDPIDAVIAATAKIRDLPLATLNLKHFPMFSGLKRPYQP
jgi:predicted nucleic acid-binding protein